MGRVGGGAGRRGRWEGLVEEVDGSVGGIGGSALWDRNP